MSINPTNNYRMTLVKSSKSKSKEQSGTSDCVNAPFLFLYMRTACARTQVTFGRCPCTSPCGSADGHRLMVYRVLSYACFAFVIKYIFLYMCCECLLTVLIHIIIEEGIQ